MSKNLIVALGVYLSPVTISAFSMDNNLQKEIAKQINLYGFCSVLYIDQVNNKLAVSSHFKCGNNHGPYSFDILNKTYDGKKLINDILSLYKRYTY